MRNELIKEVNNNMEKAFSIFTKNISGIRTGKANPSLLDSIKIQDGKGKHLNLNSVASVSPSDHKTLIIKAWDDIFVTPIKNSITNSPLSCKLDVKGNCIKVTLPELTKETRENFAKVLKNSFNDAKVAVNNIRRNTIVNLEKVKKNKKISEDEAKRITKDIDKIKDDYIKKIEENFAKKEHEILNF